MRRHRAGAVDEIEENSSSALAQLDSEVHEGRLEYHRFTKEVHATQLEARILKITKAVTEKASAAADERVRIAKE